MEDVPDLKNNLWKRQEQLDRWKTCEVNLTTSEIRDREKAVIQFPDSFVFLAACSAYDEEEILRLLKKGADINTSNVDGLTALHQACIDDDLHRVQFLVDRGADLNAQDNEGWTPLHAAASCGYVDVAKCLIKKGANIAAVNNDGELPVDLAEGNEMTKLLNVEMARQGIDADAARNEEERLMLRDAKQWLSTKSFDDRPHPKTGATALHVAASKGYTEVMKLLLQAGAAIEAKDLDGWTPLHAAAHWGQEEACKLLTDNMCNMAAKTTQGQTPFDVADPDIVTYLEDLRKQQATIRQDQEEKRQQEMTMRNSLLVGRRRSSVTRLSTDQRQDLQSKNVEEERSHLERMRRSQAPALEEEDGRVDDQHSSPAQPPSSVASSRIAWPPAAAPSSAPSRNTEVIGETYGVQMRSKRAQRGLLSEDITAKADLVVPPTIVSQAKTTTLVSASSTSAATSSTSAAAVTRASAPVGLAALRGMAPASVVTTSVPLVQPSSTSSISTTASRPPSVLQPASSVTVTTSTSSFSSSAAAIGARLNALSPPPLETTSASSPPVTFAPPISTNPANTSSRLSGLGPVTNKAPPPSLPASSLAPSYAAGDSRASLTAVSMSSGGGLVLPTLRKVGSGITGSSAASAVVSSTRVPVASVTAVTSFSTSTTSTTTSAVAANSTPVSDAGPTTLAATINSTSRKSFEAPKRDSEKEVERKARARRAREERRSTQGVTKEDLEASRQLSVDDSVDGGGVDSADRSTVDTSASAVKTSAQRRLQSSGDDRTTAVVRPEVSRPAVTTVPDFSTASRPLDYKKLYEEEKLKNDRSSQEVDRLRAELGESGTGVGERSLLPGRDSGALSCALMDSKEKRALERKISELEEEVKGMVDLRAENERLKQENAALIRVISKLSK